MLVEKEQTTFKPYVPERYSKSKRYTGDDEDINMLSESLITKLRNICSNCHQPFGKHISFTSDCPTTYILQ